MENFDGKSNIYYRFQLVSFTMNSNKNALKIQQSKWQRAINKSHNISEASC